MGTARDHGITKLYHYQDSTMRYLADTLRENWIHCSNPENFNDPWDCKPYFDPSSLEEPAQRAGWIEFFKEQHAQLTPDQQANVIAQLGPRWYDNTNLLRQSIEKTTASVDLLNRERYRIFCLNTKPTSLLMWAHYAEKHRGICLEFDATAEKLGNARKVLYADKLPGINASLLRDHTALLDAVLLTKSSEWAYEDEYRILARDGKIDPTFSLATEGDFLRLPKRSITAVIAGSRANVDAIKATIATHAPGLPVKVAVQRAHEYHLDIIDG